MPGAMGPFVNHISMWICKENEANGRATWLADGGTNHIPVLSAPAPVLHHHCGDWIPKLFCSLAAKVQAWVGTSIFYSHYWEKKKIRGLCNLRTAMPCSCSSSSMLCVPPELRGGWAHPQLNLVHIGYLAISPFVCLCAANSSWLQTIPEIDEVGTLFSYLKKMCCQQQPWVRGLPSIGAPGDVSSCHCTVLMWFFRLFALKKG
jgi:hypothetical protein